MRATERLDNLYARHELAEQAAEGRKFRLEMARLKSITLPSVGGGTEQDAADKEDDAEEKEQARIALVFANLVKPKEEEENDPTD